MQSPSFSLTVKSIVQETQDTITLVFEKSPYLLNYQAGAFITLFIPIGEEVLHRSYSLSTCVATDDFPAITIKRIPKGKVSNYLHDEIKVGDSIKAKGPKGNFVLPKKIRSAYQAVYIAGGSGITPIFSMIKSLLYQHPDSQVFLIYANRNQSNIIYAQALKKLALTYASRIQVVHILSQPTPEWQGLSGRLTSTLIRDLLRDKIMLSRKTDYFLCGPEGLMDVAYATLRGEGVDVGKIHQEKFKVALPKKPSAQQAKSLVIHYEGVAHSCKILPGETILDVALDKGIDIPFSCSSGMCNTCRAKCIKGKVDMLADEGLDEEEREAGYVLTCVGFPATEEVVIEVED
ncbi:MAG: ferredoxin--NADP reductase [Bacteroidota bacterium]